jgi:imidazolonepropionase-like amidohydrolase
MRLARLIGSAIVLALPAASLAAQGAPTSAANPSPAVKRFITVGEPVSAITHVRVIDGTGAAAREDQTVVITRGRISAVGATGSIQVPEDARIIDGTGKSVMPGLVMVHEHLFYPSGQGAIWHEEGASALRLYLGAGVTTARTGGSMHPIADLNLKKYIEAGKIPGPKLDVTGPYINGPGMDAPQMPELTTADEGRKLVSEWADKGATSFKAYMFVSREVLGAAITEAHKRGLKVTGHLCSVTFREAAALGIDNLEHGLTASTDFAPGKKADTCPLGDAANAANQALGMESDSMKAMIAELVRKKVAITSTLAVFETLVPGRPPITEATLAAMAPHTREYVQKVRAGVDLQPPGTPRARMLSMEMAFERDFALAGGTLLAGTDPTAYGAAVAGYGNWRELELLVEAGFTPLEAITIATRNGATYLGRTNVGTIASGKQADLLLVNGNPAANISDIAKVETVFKDGIGFDSAKLLASARGLIGM